MLEVLSQIQTPGGSQSSEALAIDAFLEETGAGVYATPWASMARSVADSIPKQVDYILSEWSYQRLAYEHLQIIKMSLSQEE